MLGQKCCLHPLVTNCNHRRTVLTRVITPAFLHALLPRNPLRNLKPCLIYCFLSPSQNQTKASAFLGSSKGLQRGRLRKKWPLRHLFLMRPKWLDMSGLCKPWEAWSFQWTLLHLICSQLTLGYMMNTFESIFWWVACFLGSLILIEINSESDAGAFLWCNDLLSTSFM